MAANAIRADDQASGCSSARSFDDSLQRSHGPLSPCSEGEFGALYNPT
jgi:hypothetical protein